MELLKLGKNYKHEFYEVWKDSFDDGFDDEQCEKFFAQDDLWNYAYGWIEGEKLVSTYLSLEVKLLLRNKEFRGHYIDGLATLPFYRRRGLAQEMILHDVRECLKKGIPLLILDPSIDSFYRKLGFEYALDKFRIKVKKEFCSLDDNGTNHRVESDLLAANRDLQSGYRRITEWLYNNSRYNEMKWPECYEEIKFQHNEMQIAVAYDSTNQPSGYMLFIVEDSYMVIESFRYISLNAFYALKRFMLNSAEGINSYIFTSIPGDFPIELFLTDLGRPEEKLVLSNWRSRMARILDLPSLLQSLITAKPKAPVRINVKDEILANNDGLYIITPEGQVLKESQGIGDVTITINDIVPLLTGLRSAQELYFSGKLIVGVEDDVSQNAGVVPEVIRELDHMLPKVTTYNAEDYLAP